MPDLVALMPRLRTADLRRAMKFYTGILGFKVRVLWPKRKPVFCILERSGVRIGFTESEAAGPVELSFDVKDAPGWHRKLKRRVKVEWGPEVYSYGRREFAFRDPDGHLVILTEPTTDPATCDVEL